MTEDFRYTNSYHPYEHREESKWMINIPNTFILLRGIRLQLTMELHPREGILLGQQDSCHESTATAQERTDYYLDEHRISGWMGVSHSQL